jgi:probable O-glycosylation ligase (exosortase A-associated)
MNPWRLCYGFAEFGVPFYKIAVGVTMIAAFVSGQRMKIPWTVETILLCLFSLWMSFTTMFAPNADAANMWQRVISIQLSIFITLMLIRNPTQLRWLIWVITLSLGFYGFKGGLFTILTGGGGHVLGPIASFIQDNNALALALASSIPFLRFLQVTSEHRWVRWGLACGIGLNAAAIVGTYSRGGILALAAASTLLLLRSKRRFLFLVLGGGTLAIILSVMPKAWFERMQSIESYQQDGSVQGRFDAWQFAVTLANARPITGGGFLAFQRSSWDLHAAYAEAGTIARDAHSIYFKVLGEHGYPGLLIFLSLGLSAFFSAGRVRRAVRGDPDLTWASELASACQISLVTYAVGGTFLGLLYFDLPYHVVAIIVLTKVFAREQLREREAEAAQPEPSKKWLNPAATAPAPA